MSIFSKLPLAVAVTSALVLSGCLSGGGGGGGGGGGATTPAGPTSVEGSVVKGVVLGGLVEAFEFGSDTVLSTTTTDETDGSYTLALPDDYSGAPLLIKVTAQDGTLMRCDLVVCQRDAEGKPTVSFGGEYALAADFVLQAVTPGSQASSVAVNVTPLTTLAAALAEQRSVAGADRNEAVLAANAQVADRFGLVGDLTTMKVVDVTNPEALEDSAVDSRYSVISAATVGAMLQSEAGLTPETAMNALVSQFAEGDGIADTDPDDASSLTLQTILEQSAILADTAGLTAAKAEFEAEAAKAATSGSTKPSQGKVPADVGSEGLVATKKFVQQIRDLTNTATLEENLKGFAEEVDMVSQVSGPDLKASLSATGMALRAIAEAEEARQNRVTEARFDFDGVEVNRTGKVYSVKQVLAVNGLDVAVDITADVTYVNNIKDSGKEDEVGGGGGTWQPVYASIEPESGEYSTKGDAQIKLAVSGTAGTAAARVSIQQGSHFDASGSIDVAGTWKDKWIGYDTGGYDSGYEYEYEDREQGTLLLDHIDTALTVKLEQLVTAAVTDPMSFTGKLDLNVTNFGLTRAYSDISSGSYKYVWADYSSTYRDTLEIDSELDIELAGLALTLSGEFKNSVDSLYASASLQAANVSFSQSCYQYDDYGYDSDGYYWHYDADCSVGEGAKGDVKLALNFDLDLVGMSDPISVAVNARNQGLDSFIGDARLSYGGRSLQLDYAGADSVTVKNHNDVVLTLEESSGDVLTGDIQWKGKEYATVDMELGAPRIRYADGTFEVL